MNLNEKRRLTLMILTLLVVVGVVFVYLSAGDSGLNTNEAKDYIAENHVQDTSAGNAVTAVYLNYRFFDTIFESLILLVSVLAVMMLSWSANKQD